MERYAPVNTSILGWYVRNLIINIMTCIIDWMAILYNYVDLYLRIGSTSRVLFNRGFTKIHIHKLYVYLKCNSIYDVILSGGWVFYDVYINSMNCTGLHDSIQSVYIHTCTYNDTSATHINPGISYYKAMENVRRMQCIIHLYLSGCNHFSCLVHACFNKIGIVTHLN